MNKILLITSSFLLACAFSCTNQKTPDQPSEQMPQTIDQPKETETPNPVLPNPPASSEETSQKITVTPIVVEAVKIEQPVEKIHLVIDSSSAENAVMHKESISEDKSTEIQKDLTN